MIQTTLCQKNYKEKLGKCTVTVATHGCALVSLTMVAERTDVLAINDLLNHNAGYVDKCNMVWKRAAELLGLEYNPDQGSAKFYPTIAWTNRYAPKVPQHFFVVDSPTTIIDPLDGMRKSIDTYRIRGWRNIRKKQEENMNMWDDPRCWEMVINSIRVMRELYMGHIDEAGANADALRVKNSPHPDAELGSVNRDLWNSAEAVAHRGDCDAKLTEIRKIVM